MEINLPRIIDATMPNRGDRNIGIISSSNGFNHNDPGFLSNDFPHSPPKLYITAESDDFDVLTVNEWKDEGFNVEYISMGDGGNEYRTKLESLSRTDLGPCETFGIVAYGDAASFCLEHFHVLDNNSEFRLSCLVAYYPTRIPDPRTRFPGGVHVLVHLASGEAVGIVKQTQMIGIQGKKRVVKRTIDRGKGAGGVLQMSYPGYTYDATPGFAEHDLDEFDRVSAELSWSRSLATVRRAFRKDVDLEKTVEQNVEGKFYARDLQQTLSTYSTHKSPHVTYVPTLTGGIGSEELQRFYSEFFLDRNPPSVKLSLLSRTIGADRVVDELHVAFKHTQEMPWILPGVPPTNKRVEILVVSIVTLRGGQLCHEHVYWDQASVLVQIGLLDPKVVPVKAREKGLKRLPVVGKEAARRVQRGYDEGDEGEATNELIAEWNDDIDDDDAYNDGNNNTSKNEKSEEKERKDEKPEHSREREFEKESPSQPPIEGEKSEAS
ncbi:NTF2-like protein [Annulohypoxylon maeteangense]|uniref:NTF2-like protein n=1 Tax=Annulohypoxylon maeteangense TaxID=1927788 RepID=UPI00200734CC|nr:NTF2-like protein [Annulohypoxylon maeteangense]KAI0880541.1 NTF2-like protein [Annulohypoxylon maeteangense]